MAIDLLLNHKVGHVFLNDSSLHVYAFWYAALRNPERFCRRILRASLTLTDWERHREIVRNARTHDLEELGFSTFYLNRCNRSGILTAGIIGGRGQRGKWRLDARFPRNELIRRIEAIAPVAHRITLSNLDAEVFMLKRVNKLGANTLVYCDPPYYERAGRLYLSRYSKPDHVRLATLIQKTLRCPWLVSYDDHPEILRLYRGRRLFKYSLQYSAVRSYTGQETFVFSDGLKLPRCSVVPSIAKGLRGLRRVPLGRVIDMGSL